MVELTFNIRLVPQTKKIVYRDIEKGLGLLRYGPTVRVLFETIMILW